MEIVCQQCGDNGFENAYVYCANCLNIAIHRYCLPILPGTFDEFVSWLCVDCDPELVSRFHLKNKDYSACSVSERSSEVQSVPELIKQPQSTFHSPLPTIKLKKKNCMTYKAAETGEQRHHMSGSCRSHINVDLSEYALEHDSSSGTSSKKIKKYGLASSEAEAVDGRRESSHLHKRHKNLDLTDCANLECDLSPLINSRENGIASTIAGMKKQNFQTIPSQKPSELPEEHASNIASSSLVCENLNVRDSGIHLKDRRSILEDRSKVDEEVVGMGVPNYLEAHDDSPTVPNQNYHPPAQPIIDEIWRGSFSILNRSYGLADGVVAHLSSKACSKVCEEAGLLPSSLCLEMLPKMTLWPICFLKAEPYDHIGLFFFPRMERFRRSFDHLIEDMMCRELAMRSVVKNAELLVFTSCELPLQYWKFQGNYFLWGVFRAKQSPSSCPEDHHLVVQNRKIESCTHLSSANDVGTDSESSNSIKKINILNARSPLSPLSNTCSSGYWPY